MFIKFLLNSTIKSDRFSDEGGKLRHVGQKVFRHKADLVIELFEPLVQFIDARCFKAVNAAEFVDVISDVVFHSGADLCDNVVPVRNEVTFKRQGDIASCFRAFRGNVHNVFVLQKVLRLAVHVLGRLLQSYLKDFFIRHLYSPINHTYPKMRPPYSGKALRQSYNF